MGRTLNKIKALLDGYSVPLIRHSIILFVLSFWYGVYMLVKAIF